MLKWNLARVRSTSAEFHLTRVFISISNHPEWENPILLEKTTQQLHYSLKFEILNNYSYNCHFTEKTRKKSKQIKNHYEISISQCFWVMKSITKYPFPNDIWQKKRAKFKERWEMDITWGFSSLKNALGNGYFVTIFDFETNFSFTIVT